MFEVHMAEHELEAYFRRIAAVGLAVLPRNGWCSWGLVSLWTPLEVTRSWPWFAFPTGDLQLLGRACSRGDLSPVSRVCKRHWDVTPFL